MLTNRPPPANFPMVLRDKVGGPTHPCSACHPNNDEKEAVTMAPPQIQHGLDRGPQTAELQAGDSCMNQGWYK